jgi:uncharacterized protein (DUF697 family)
MAASSGATIGTLVVRAPGLDAVGARRLAQAVGEALAQNLTGSLAAHRSIAELRLHVALPHPVAGSQLAATIARRISEAIG